MSDHAWLLNVTFSGVYEHLPRTLPNIGNKQEHVRFAGEEVSIVSRPSASLFLVSGVMAPPYRSCKPPRPSFSPPLHGHCSHVSTRCSLLLGGNEFTHAPFFASEVHVVHPTVGVVGPAWACKWSTSLSQPLTQLIVPVLTCRRLCRLARLLCELPARPPRSYGRSAPPPLQSAVQRPSFRCTPGQWACTVNRDEQMGHTSKGKLTSGAGLVRR
jgi:hypothetical protein